MPINLRNSFSSLAFVSLLASCGEAPPEAPSQRNDDPMVLFFDDFSESKLDTSKWNVLITGQVFNNENQAYVDSAVTIYIVDSANAEGAENGALALHPRYSKDFITADGQKFDFISGRIHTRDKFHFTYGKAEARLKITEGKGFWPAWWMLGNGDWPQTGEIDIMEYVGQNEWTNSALHGPGYSGADAFFRADSFAVKNPVSNWHVYAVEWTPDSLIFSVDGNEYYTITKSMVEEKGKWVFDDPQHLILNFAVGGSYPHGQNGIREPYLGIPQESVDKIKAGNVRVLVDWVKVTAPEKQNKSE